MSERYHHYQRLSFDHPVDGVLRITMKGEGKVNAADRVMHRELASVWRDVGEDPGARAVVLRGAESAFSAGGSFDMIEDLVNDPQYRLAGWKEARDIVYNVVNCDRPIVTALNGPCVGAGLAAALVTDITVAARNAKIIDGHTRLGVPAGDHCAIIWPLLVGMARAKYYLLTCEPITGEEAERIGLVSLCVDDDEVQERAVEIAARLANGAQSALRLTKYALNNWLRMAGPTFDTSLALEFMSWDGREAREGLASFRDKRKADFPKDSPI